MLSSHTNQPLFLLRHFLQIEYQLSLLVLFFEKKRLFAGLICPHLEHFFMGYPRLVYSQIKKSSLAYSAITFGILLRHRLEIYSTL
jgi:hypothetical protein